MLKQIMLEAEPPADPAAPLPWPRARELRALTYVYRLEWPNMTKTTLTATLKSLGRSINTYRNTIGATLEPGARKPIQRIAIAQTCYYQTHSYSPTTACPSILSPN